MIKLAYKRQKLTWKTNLDFLSTWPKLSTGNQTSFIFQTLWTTKEDFIRILWPIFLRWNRQFYHFNDDCLCLDHHRSLVSHGCHGNWPVCGFHCICEIAQFESIYFTFIWAFIIWRFLGLFLQVCLQCQCDGSRGHATCQQSYECHGQETAFDTSS